MKNLPGLVRVGDRVRVRRQRWSVADVRLHDGCQVLALHGIGPLNTGSRRSVVAPFDVVEPLERPARVRIVGSRQWRRRCRSVLAAPRRPGHLTTAARAGIDLLPHQLEPALAILKGLGSRVLIADEVGLGKTVQAGLIMSELDARGAIDRVLVLTPAGLRDQWSTELRDRFGLNAAVVDAHGARRRSARLPVGVNPWATLPLVIASIDFVKRPEVLPAVAACRWDVVVVDEAHGVASATDRHRSVCAICEAAAYVVLLTATPHNGNRPAFESLCGIGAVEGERPGRLLAFRRTRRDVAWGRDRRIHSLRVRSSAEEIRMHEHLARFTRAVRSEHGDGVLALAVLHKRALSSAHALQRSVERRLAALQSGSPCDADGPEQLALPLDDGGGELDASDSAPVWTTPALSDADRERRTLEGLVNAAREASGRETKLTRLTRLLLALGSRDESAIVFTEYRDTLFHIRRSLERSDRGTGGAVVMLHGGMTRDERKQALEDFQRTSRAILLATDAGGEGLNLHQKCRVVINLELPWNPMRLEQRIGRVDRIGQRRRVHAFNLIACDTGEWRVLDRLKARLARARQDIGVADPLTDATDEDVVISVVLDGRPSDERIEGRPAEAEISERLYDTPRLSEDATAEHARLLQARRLEGAGPDCTPADTHPTPDSWLAFARHPTTRARLSPGVLVILQSTIEDPSGRLVASDLMPIVVEPAKRLGRPGIRGIAAAIVRALESSWMRHGLDAGSLEAHHEFWRTRISRERAIAGRLLQLKPAIRQPGLFDRRAPLEAGIPATLELDAVRRLAALAARESLDAARTTAVLILVP